MKYMGSKKSMLKNGLGELLNELLPKKNRFFDLFCGSGAVAGYVAQRFDVAVCASDLQQYAVALTAPQVEQTQTFSAEEVWEKWVEGSREWLLSQNVSFERLQELGPKQHSFSSWRAAIREVRDYCAALPACFPLSKAYGGYYFSHDQALHLDALRANLPRRHQGAALAALIDAASSCAAAPGHTAQPFSTSDSALPHLATAWARDIVRSTLVALQRTSQTVAKTEGEAKLVDAIQLTRVLQENDVAFLDPPYSEVQYSRFYHVLEAVARGGVKDVAGVGRYPPIFDRPQSLFCRPTQSAEALDNLMLRVAVAGADAIITFPAGDASNGLSGELVEEISGQYFKVNSRKVTSIFSTLGGNSVNRHARKATTELVLHLTPR